MKFEVDKINIIRGEFQILPPDVQVPDGRNGIPTLIVACNYALVNKKGIPVASGTAGNVPNMTNTSAPLSEDTLSAFQNFFSLLEQDIANAFEGTISDQQRTPLERLLAPQISKPT